MNKTDQEIGERIRAARQARGLSQSELGRRMGMCPQVVSRWETGVASPLACNLKALCEALEISADALLFGKVPKWRDR